MIIDEIIDRILEVDSFDRCELVLAVAREGLCGHINNNDLIDLLVADYKSELEEDALYMDDKDIINEYCEVYGFECLVEELASRREEGEEDEL